MVSGCWSLNWNLGLHDYKAAQSNPDILLRREPEWQDGYSIARQVKGKARISVIPVYLAELTSEAGFLSVLLVVNGLLSAHLIPRVVPTFSHSSDLSWLSASYCSPPSRSVHDPPLVNTLPKELRLVLL